MSTLDVCACFYCLSRRARKTLRGCFRLPILAIFKGLGKMGAQEDGKSAAVLVLDDWESFRTVTRVFLEKHGYVVFTAKSFEQTLQLIKNESIDVLLLDIRMPVMDGFKVLQALKQEGLLDSGLKVMMVTANADPRDLQRAESLGAHGFLNKPYTPDELLQQLEELCP